MGTDVAVTRASALQLACTIWPHANAECASIRILGPIAVAACVNHRELHSRGIFAAMCNAVLGWAGYEVGYRDHVHLSMLPACVEAAHRGVGFSFCGNVEA